MTKTQLVEVAHVPIAQGRASLRGVSWENAFIASVSPMLDTRWRAQFKEKYLDPGESRKFLTEILKHVQTLNGITTQRAIYYAIRGAHPEWTYKGEPLGDQFYEHLVMWIMEKIQLMTGYTMQSLGIWAAPRGYIIGDGTIRTTGRAQMPLSGKPVLGFDMADVGMTLATNARKVIHFEKDAGLDALTSASFPRYIESIFSTSQGQLTEAANKFLRQCEDRGLALYSVHDGDPSGIQMQLLYGMATKNNCYMPTEFYPRLVKPLGFYPSIGEALRLPPEDVTEKEDKIFDNLLELVDGKQRAFPELRRFGLVQEVEVIVTERKKWEFQALNAIHESAPKIYLLEGLRVHNDEVKHVPAAETIKAGVISASVTNAKAKVSSSIEALASSLMQDAVRQVVAAVKEALVAEILAYLSDVAEAERLLKEIPAEDFREFVKRRLIEKPDRYSVDVIKAWNVINSSFTPTAKIKVNYELTDIYVNRPVQPVAPADREYTTKTMLVEAIEKEVIPNVRVREQVVGLIRSALEQRFGAASEQW